MIRKLSDYFWRLYCLAIYAVTYNYCRLVHDPMTWGRHGSPVPRQCQSCGYVGLEKWFLHGYRYIVIGDDIEQCDRCPRCGADEDFIFTIIRN